MLKDYSYVILKFHVFLVCRVLVCITELTCVKVEGKTDLGCL